LISIGAANASRSLNELFNSFRPRNKKIPDEVVGSLQVLDEQLDKLLVPYKKVEAFEDAEDSDALSPAPASPPGPSNGVHKGPDIPGQFQS
jgi:hypothetical protein